VGARRGAVLVLLGALALASTARAHLGHDVARAERYLKVDVAAHTARVVVSLTLGAAEGGRLLRAADADGDGLVSEAERDAYLAGWGAGLANELPIELDGERQPAVWGEPYMDPIGPVQAVPVTVEMVARVELGGGRQTLRVTDTMVRREVYDRTDVAFRARDGASLVASGLEAAPTEPVPDLAYGASEANASTPVVLAAVLETPERPGAVPWPVVIGAIALLVIFGASVVIVRRRR
jgi:hypothetical protein